MTTAHSQNQDIDLQKFCAIAPYDLKYLRKPTRCEDGIVATDGHILICMPDDGRECEISNEKIATVIPRFKQYLDENNRKWFDTSSIELPQKKDCSHCNGRGFDHLLYCEECDGEGLFAHGSHTYTCKACDGLGSMKVFSSTVGANKHICCYCDGTGEELQPISLGGSNFASRYLRLLAGLPSCRIGIAGEFDTASVIFSGGWGALMPYRVS